MITENEVRLAVPADAIGIAELSKSAIEHGLPWCWTPQRIAKNIADSATNVVVVHQKNTLAGFAIMKYRDDDAHLNLLAVHPAFRRQGVGSAMLFWLEAAARTAGIDLIRLETRARNATAITFYQTHGYQVMCLRKGYYMGVEDAVRLAKDLWEQP